MKKATVKKVIKYVVIAVLILDLMLVTAVSALYVYNEYRDYVVNTSIEDKDSGWVPNKNNPVLGSEKTKSLFDPSVIKVGHKYRLYVSTRRNDCISMAESTDGASWGKLKVVLSKNGESGWEDSVSRASILYHNKTYYLYYTGESKGVRRIGVATSKDGVNFKRGKHYILQPEYVYEGEGLMNPSVIYDNEEKIFKMWYSAGELYEPDVICYAESKDGVHFKKYDNNPMFTRGWDAYDKSKVAIGQVVKTDNKYLMFYIGYKNVDYASVCCAVSPDGINNWKRVDTNPLIKPDSGEWNDDACYHPSALFDKEKNRWMIWFNGRDEMQECIGLYYHKGYNFGF